MNLLRACIYLTYKFRGLAEVNKFSIIGCLSSIMNRKKELNYQDTLLNELSRCDLIIYGSINFLLLLSSPNDGNKLLQMYPQARRFHFFGAFGSRLVISMTHQNI